MSNPQTNVLDAVHRVVTPESVGFEFVLAGLYARALAWLVDRLIVLMVFVTLVLLGGFMAGSWAKLFTAIALLLYFLLDWGYMILFETLWAGQSPGKRALGLRVLQEGGVRVGFEQVLLRNLARAVDGLPVLYAVGGGVALLSERHQRLGDLLAGTIVVRDRRLSAPKGLQLPEKGAAAPEPLLAQRAGRLSHDERTLVLDAVRRRDELDLEARLRLFEPLSERVEATMGLGRPPHLSAENWCRWIALALLRPAARSSSSANQLNQRPSVNAPP